MSSPVAIILLVILLLIFVAVAGIFMWSKRHTDNTAFGNQKHKKKNSEKRDGSRRKFTNNDRQAALLIRELADIMNTVDKKLK